MIITCRFLKSQIIIRYRQQMFGVYNPDDLSLQLSESRQRVVIPSAIFSHNRQKDKSNPTTARTQTGRYSLYNSTVSGDHEEPRSSNLKNHVKEQRCQTNDKENRHRLNEREPNNSSCENHSNKPAKYTVKGQDEQTVYYCEKCAILVASQGFRVSRLKQGPACPSANSQSVTKKNNTCRSLGANRYMSTESSKYTVREAEIKSLVTCLEVTARQIEMKSKQLIQTAEKCRDQFNIEVSSVEEFFDRFKAFVETSRRSYHKLLFQQNQCVEETLKDVRDMLDKAAKKTLTMREDLLNNLEVVYSIKEQSYREVVDNYLANNRNFTGLVQQWKEEELLPPQLTIPRFDTITNNLRSSLLISDEPKPAIKKLKGDAGVIYFSFDATLPHSNDQLQNTIISSASNIRNHDTFTIPESLMCEDSSSDSDLLM